MATPHDYTLNVQQSPVQAFAGGYALGQGIRNDFQQQQDRQAAMAAQAAESQRQNQVIQDLLLKKNATAEDYANASVLLPGGMREQIEQAWKMRNTAQQESALKDMGQAYSAILSGRPDIAVQQMQAKADAMEKAGASPQEIQALRTNAQVIQQNPNLGALTIHRMLSFVPGGDKVIQGLSGAGTEQRAQALAPAALTTANAKAAVEPERQALEVRNLAEDAETKALGRQISQLDTQIKQANSETQRGELVLKQQELQQKLDEKKQAKADAEQGKMDSIDRSLQSVDAIMRHPALNSFWSLGTPGTLAGKVTQYIPGSDRKDVQSLVDTLTSQQFLTSIKEMQGMGALSDAEGKRIASAVSSLDLDQSAGSFKTALGVIRSTLEKARNKSVASGNLPTAQGGGGFVMKHPTFGNVGEADINRLMASQPGATREQVLEYLRSTGGK